MLRWKKRDEGFEWQQYVRTTIKLRREARREKAQRLGENVAAGARAAGAAADGLARSGAERAGDLARRGLSRTGALAARLLGLAGQGLGFAARWLARVIEPAMDVLGRPGVSGPMLLVGAIALLAGFGRLAFATVGLDGETQAALALGALCSALAVAPALWHGHLALPLSKGKVALGPVPRWAIGGLALAALGGIGLAMTPSGWRPDAIVTGSLSSLPFARTETVSGAATVLAASELRIGDSRIRLSGLDVPDPEQRCQRATAKGASRSWACGEEAREITARIVRGQSLSCEVRRRQPDGIAAGRCSVAGADLGAAIVRAGYAFAATGLAATYRSEEAEARAAKSGIWATADPERPDAWRARHWEAAKKQAPDGCPIKGRVKGSDRLYVLPWSSEYGRVRLSERRGERWFCTEEEAVAAGFRNARGG